MSLHEPRRYRKVVAAEGLVRFEVAVAETDLMVLAERELHDEARAAARDARRQIQTHGALHAEFFSARRPLPVEQDAPEIVLAMYRGAQAAGTGPMAAVAGAVAEYVARALSESSAEVIVENGGDLFLLTRHERLVSVSAPGSPMDGRMALVAPPGERAICTSSGTVGHSASAGRAEAVAISAPEGALADAIATATANRVRGADDVQAAIDFARASAELEHILIICGDTVGAWGHLELTEGPAASKDDPDA